MSTPEIYPRVLFITPHAFNKVSGTGITFTNLFKGWPKDRIATVHNDAMAVTTDVCDTYYRLGGDEIRKFGGSITNQSATQDDTGLISSSQPSGRMKVLLAAKKWIFGDGLPQRGILTHELGAWIEEFKPDVIYTILGSNGLMDIVEHVQQRFDIPMVVHIMDDWMSGAFKTGLLGWVQRRRMLKSVRRIIEKSSLRFSICDAMSEAYLERFGVPFESFQNVVNIEAVAPYVTDPTVLGSPVKIVYAGSVFEYAQQQSLIDCCQAVAQLANEGASVQLDIHCPPSHISGMEEQFVVGPAIKLHGPLTDDDDFFSTICSADILLLPTNFDHRSIDFIRYSMPTRVPAYLASGTPILLYGPSEVAQVQYAEKSSWGLVLVNRDIEMLKEAIMSLIEDTKYRAKLSACACKTALESHDVQHVHEIFRMSLATLHANEKERLH